MSAAADRATVFLLLADHVAGDVSGKFNVLGGGIQVVQRLVETGATVPFALVVTAEFPPDFVGETPAIEISLRDEATDALVEIPGFGQQGEAQPVRVGSAQALEEPAFQGSNVPRRVFGPRLQFVLAFGNGLPLAAGNVYRWAVSIDGDRRPHWELLFAIPGPPPPPVFG